MWVTLLPIACHSRSPAVALSFASILLFVPPCLALPPPCALVHAPSSSVFLRLCVLSLPLSLTPNTRTRTRTRAHTRVACRQLMVQGDKWEMYIPSELGYGEGGSGADIKGRCRHDSALGPFCLRCWRVDSACQKGTGATRRLISFLLLSSRCRVCRVRRAYC